MKPSTERLPALPIATGVLLVLSAGLAAYSNSLDVPLQFDDLPNIVHRVESHALSLSASNLARAATGFPANRWLAHATFAANHAVNGLSPSGFHVVNVAIHLLAALAVTALAAELQLAFGESSPRRRLGGALIAGLLFVVHPTATMAVTYVVQRMTSLGALFALWALWFWLRGRRSRRLPSFLAAAVLWFLSYSCKENYAALPLLVITIEWARGTDFRGAISNHPALSAITGAALIAAGASLLWAYWPIIASEQLRLGTPMTHRLLSQPRVLCHYASLIVLPLPSRLHVDYAWPVSTGLLAPPTTLPAIIAVTSAAVLAVALRRRAPMVALAIGWFFTALAVEQSAFPVDLVFEQRLYFAAIGTFICVGVSVFRWSPGLRAWAMCLPLAAALGIATRARNEAWRNPVRLYSDPLASGPGQVRSLLVLGRAFLERHDLDDAERTFRRAAQLDPRSPRPRTDLGVVELDRGHLAAAEAWFRDALRKEPGDPDAQYDLGVDLERQGRIDEARREYEELLTGTPGQTDARVNLALLKLNRGDEPGALVQLDEALRIDASAVVALMDRALLLTRMGRYADALRDATSAIAMAPQDADAHYALARVHESAHRIDAARIAANEVLRLRPDHAGARALLARISSGVP